MSITSFAIVAPLLLFPQVSPPSSATATPGSTSSTLSTPQRGRRRSSVSSAMKNSQSPSFDDHIRHAGYYPGPPPIFHLNPPSRQLITRKLAVQLLQPLNEGAFKTLVLSGSSFGDAAATVAGPFLVALARRNCLHTVILSDIIATLSAEEACRSISTIASAIGVYKKLVAVDLSDNAIGTMGIAHCAPLLSGQLELAHVNLQNTGLSAQAMRLLHQYLTESDPTALRSINLHRNRIGSEGLEHIAAVVAKSSELEYLCVSSIGASAQAVEALSKELAKTPNMRTIDISDNGFSLEAASTLSKAFESHTNLTRIMLADLNLTSMMLSPIASALSTACPPLRELNLSGNELDASAGTTLSKLILALSSTLRNLDISSNELGNHGVSDLADGIAQLPQSSPLETVNIADNEAGTVAILKLAVTLAPRSGISKFDIRSNDVLSTAAQRAAAAFPPSVVMYLDDSDDEGDAASSNQDAAGDGFMGDGVRKGEEGTALDENNDGGSAAGRNSKDSDIEALLQSLEALGLARTVCEANPTSEEGALLVSVASPEITTSVTVPTDNIGASPTVESTVNDEADEIIPGNISGGENASSVSTVPQDIASEGAAMDDKILSKLDNTSSNEKLYAEEGPATPPPSRFLGLRESSSSTNDSGQVTQRDKVSNEASTGDTSVAAGIDYSNESGDRNVMDSARKLKASINSLSREISDVAGELKMDVEGSPLEVAIADSTVEVSRVGDGANSDIDDNDEEIEDANEDEEDANDYLLVGDRVISNNYRKGVIAGPAILDCVGGVIVALFVIVLVLAIVQSQEESTFSYRLV